MSWNKSKELIIIKSLIILILIFNSYISFYWDYEATVNASNIQEFTNNNYYIKNESKIRTADNIITEVTLPTNVGTDKFPSTVIYDNKLYIAWTSNDQEITSPTFGGDPDYDIVIRSFDGQTWSEIYELSTRAIETGTNTGENEGYEDDYFPSLITYQDKLFVFWEHCIGLKYEPSVVRMRYYDGNTWSNIINFSYGVPGDGVTYKDKLYYAWYGGEQYYNCSFHVKVFDGTTWSVPKANDSSEGGVSDLKVNDEDNSLYVCWGNTDNTCMRRFNGNTWDDKIVIDEQGQYRWDSESNNGPELCFFNGSGNIIWSKPGSINFRSFEGPNLSDIILLNKTPADQHKYNPKLIEFRDTLFASWDYGSGSKRHIILRAFNGNSWNEIQELTPNSKSRNSHLELIEFNNVLFLIWQTNDPNISNGSDLDIVIRPLFGSFLACQVKPQTISPGESAAYNITVSNIAIPKSKIDNNIKLELTGLPVNWGARFDKQEVNLDISESINVILTITAPNDAKKDQWANISILCSQKDLSVIEDSITISTFMDVKYGISLSCEEQNRSVAPEESVCYTIKIRNNGNINDTIDLSLSIIPQLPPTFPFWVIKLESKFINLVPNSSGIIFLNITAPANSSHGEKVLIKILGTSRRDPNSICYVETKTIVKLVRDLELFCIDSKHYVNPGEETNYIINITNNGNDVDTIIFSTSEFKWDISLNQSKISLNPFETQQINLSIQVPKIAIAKTIDKGTIIAESLEGNTTDTLEIITIVNQIHIILANIDKNYVKTVPNCTINFTMNISNNGNGVEVINLLVNNLSFICRINFSQGLNNELQTDLGPYEEISIGISIYIPKNTMPDEYKIEINLSTETKNITFKIYIEVFADSDTDTVPDGIDAFPKDPLYSFDSDYDGIPDAWETKYGLDPYNYSDAHLDNDRDRFSNLEEFILGTDPTKSDYYPNGSFPKRDPEKNNDENILPDSFQFFIILTIIIILSLIMFGIITVMKKKLKED